MNNVVVVHYHEIGLKGGNRSFFERALARNLREATAPHGAQSIETLRGRLLVRSDGPVREALLDAVGRTFGVAVYAPALEVSADIDAMKVAAMRLLASQTFSTFAIVSRRATKNLPFTSKDMNIQLGAHVQAETGAGVHLDDPDVAVHVEVVNASAYVYTDRRRGPGGLPSRSSGRVLSLLSGGIDSPVATWRMMRRGAKASMCHFHSEPFTDRASTRKAQELARILARWQGDSTLYLVPFGSAQQDIVVACPPPLRVVLYRRFMIRIAEELARAEGAHALVTGDSLGQVASQTIENITCIEDAATMPVLRPLIGDDKQDIVTEARRIGTFETSILPYADCCSLFVPKSPATRASVAECIDAERALDVGHLVERCVKETEVERIVRGEP